MNLKHLNELVIIFGKYINTLPSPLPPLLLDHYKNFQEEIGVPKDKIVGYGNINSEFVDPQKLFLFRIKHGI